MSAAPVAPVAPVTLVIGPEELLVERAVADVVAAARAGGPDPVDVRDLVAAGASAGDFVGLTSPSLFQDRAVVVVRDLQDAGDDLAGALTAYARAPVDGVAVALVHNGRAKGKRVLDAVRRAGAAEVPCLEVKTRRDRLRFVTAEVRRHRRKASEEAVATLLDAVGGDLRSLAAACSQLAADTDGPIDVEVVRRYYAGVTEVSGFAVAEHALEGRSAEALARLRWAVQAGTDPVPIVAALAMGLRQVVKVAAAPRGVAAADLARSLGMPAWKVDAVRRQLRGWTPQGIATALAAVADADAQVKGAGTDPVYAVERAVVVIAGARGS